MKYSLLTALLVLAGCQAAPSEPTVPLPARPGVATPPAPIAPDAPGAADLAAKVRLQAQYIEALLSQNEALKTDRSVTTTPAISQAVGPILPMPVHPSLAVSPVGAAISTEEPALMPNAEGVIDLTATTAKSGELVNPFAVRTVSEGSGREVLVHVSGLVAGPKACAIINERLVEAGDTLESFRVERIDPETVLLRLGERRLRLPLTERPVRVLLPN